MNVPLEPIEPEQMEQQQPNCYSIMPRISTPSSRKELERRKKRERTELHVRKEPESTTLCATFDETHDVNPELHVFRSWSCVFVHEEDHEDTGVYSNMATEER